MNMALRFPSGFTSSFTSGFTSILVLALSMAGGARAAPATVLAPQIAGDYVKAQQRVDIGGGRKLNLHCRGDGPVTVLFDAGHADWSNAWALVQPAVSAKGRACTYDRAGLGYSDAAQRPATPDNVIEDLRALIKNAGIKGPLVLVGHSLGGYNMKHFAAAYPAEVAALVLVDPSEERVAARLRPAVAARFGDPGAAFIDSYTDWMKVAVPRYQGCADAARAQDLDPAGALYPKCSDPDRPRLGELIAAERKRIQVRHAYQAARASELAHCVYAADAARDARLAALFRPAALGGMPVIVLSASGAAPADVRAEAAQFTRFQLNAMSAALSSRGQHRVVPDTVSNMQMDRPDAIVGAIADVIASLPGSGAAAGATTAGK